MFNSSCTHGRTQSPTSLNPADLNSPDLQQVATSQGFPVRVHRPSLESQMSYIRNIITKATSESDIRLAKIAIQSLNAEIETRNNTFHVAQLVIDSLDDFTDLGLGPEDLRIIFIRVRALVFGPWKHSLQDDYAGRSISHVPSFDSILDFLTRPNEHDLELEYDPSDREPRWYTDKPVLPTYVHNRQKSGSHAKVATNRNCDLEAETITTKTGYKPPAYVAPSNQHEFVYGSRINLPKTRGSLCMSVYSHDSTEFLSSTSCSALDPHTHAHLFVTDPRSRHSSIGARKLGILRHTSCESRSRLNPKRKSWELNRLDDISSTSSYDGLLRLSSLQLYDADEVDYVSVQSLFSITSSRSGNIVRIPTPESDKECVQRRYFSAFEAGRIRARESVSTFQSATLKPKYGSRTSLIADLKSRLQSSTGICACSGPICDLGRLLKQLEYLQVHCFYTAAKVLEKYVLYVSKAGEVKTVGDTVGQAFREISAKSDGKASTTSQTNCDKHSCCEWTAEFISSRGNEYFCDVDEEYLTDRFNLTGLNNEVQYYQYALDLVTDLFDLECDDEMREAIEKSARHLYGLVHARYIVTTRGLQKMTEKYKKGEFGKCPRVACEGQYLLPTGQHDIPNMSAVKLYCARCEDLYNPKSSRHALIDGAYFGTSFSNILFQVYPTLLPPKSARRYEPKIYGFRVHAHAALARWQEMQLDNVKQKLQAENIETGFEDEEREDAEAQSVEEEDAIDDMFEGKTA